jgi:ABC-type Fe3+ transport system permease subunit
MRAICGAIITAGALIGLGLAVLGIGLRYNNYSHPDATTGNVLRRDWSGDKNFSYGLPDKDHAVAWVKFSEMDNALQVIVVVLILAVLAGLATAFIGLAFHHHRRMQELEHLRHRISGAPAAVPPPPGV